MTESEDAIINAASQSTAANFAEAKRITTLLRRSKPQWDDDEEQGVANFTARFKLECPWEVVFESIAKDSPLRTAWGELPSVEQLMEAMSQTTEAAGGTAEAEMEVPTGVDVRDQVMAAVTERNPAQKSAPSTEGAGPAQKEQSGGAASASSQKGAQKGAAGPPDEI